MKERPEQQELFPVPDNSAEEVDAPFTESVEGASRSSRKKKPKIAPVGQEDIFPQDLEYARRIARWRTPELKEAQKLVIELEKKALRAQAERKQKRNPDDVIH